MARYGGDDSPPEFTPKPVPDAVVNGKPNPEYYRTKWSNSIDRNDAWVDQKGRPMPGFDDVLKAISKEAEMAGYDMRAMADQRSPEQRLIEVIEGLLSGGIGIWEVASDELHLLCEAMDKADAGVIAEFVAKRDAADAKMIAPLTKAKKVEFEKLKKAWLNLISGVEQIQHRAATTVPKGTDLTLAHAYSAARLLRYMIYVGRSNIPERLSGPSRGVYYPAFHLCKAAWHLYESRNAIHFSCVGVETNAYKCDGAILVMPPGHGKTDLIRADAALTAVDEPKTQGFMIHAIKTMAEKNLQYLQSIFDNSKIEGRRNLALFPTIRLSKEHNTQKAMRLHLPGISLKSNTYEASGVMTAMSGANASTIYFDDPVDQDAVHSETERNRTSDRISGVWLPRLRGKRGSFYVMIATLWHEDDAVARRISMAERGEIPVKVMVLGAGGPTGNAFTTEPFASIWPEEFPPSRLRDKYNEMRNPRLYACQYMCVTMSEESRVVRKVRFYDPRDPAHAEFLRRAIFHLSADPAATAKAKSDNAGIVYAAFGELTVHEDESATVAEPRLRIISSYEIKATQSDLAHWMGEHAISMPVDHCHAETVGAFVAVAEIIRDKYGIDVITHPTRNKDKLTRLKQAAPAIDDFYGMACVEFPGVKTIGPDGEELWKPAPEVGAMIHQILNFGATKEDHTVDAVTQLTNHLMPSLRPGREGQASSRARVFAKKGAEQEAKARFWDEWTSDVTKPKMRNETQVFNAMFN